MEQKDKKPIKFSDMPIGQLDSCYSVLARGNGKIAAKDWMDEIDSAVNKYVDSKMSESLDKK
jgi:hypothetical protein